MHLTYKSTDPSLIYEHFFIGMVSQFGLHDLYSTTLGGSTTAFDRDSSRWRTWAPWCLSSHLHSAALCRPSWGQQPARWGADQRGSFSALRVAGIWAVGGHQWQLSLSQNVRWLNHGEISGGWRGGVKWETTKRKRQGEKNKLGGFGGETPRTKPSLRNSFHRYRVDRCIENQYITSCIPEWIFFWCPVEACL